MKKNKNKFTKERILNALIASLTIFVLTAGNIAITTKEVVAFAGNLKLNSQTEDTLNKYVKFDTFFSQDNEKTHYLICDVNGQKQDMYMSISVKEGYLKDAYIEFVDKNYDIEGILDEKQILQEATNEKIVLNQLNADEENFLLVAQIGRKLEEQIKVDDINKESKVIFNATHVNKKGQEKTVQKEVKINVGYKENIELKLQQEVLSYFAFQKDGQNKVFVKIGAKLNSSSVLEGQEETVEQNNLPIKETKITADYPRLNNIMPESITIIPNSTVMTNGQTEEKLVYTNEQIKNNQEEGTVSISVKNIEVDEGLYTSKGQDEYIITCIYPYDEVFTRRNNTKSIFKYKSKCIQIYSRYYK